MGLARKLEQNVLKIIELETERAKILTQLFYDPSLQKKAKEAQASAMKSKADELFEQKRKLWKEAFED